MLYVSATFSSVLALVQAMEAFASSRYFKYIGTAAPANTTRMATTTSNSIRVKPPRLVARHFRNCMGNSPQNTNQVPVILDAESLRHDEFACSTHLLILPQNSS